MTAILPVDKIAAREDINRRHRERYGDPHKNWAGWIFEEAIEARATITVMEREKEKHLQCLRALRRLIDEKDLVRDVTNDHDGSKFTAQGLRITEVIAQLQEILDGPPTKTGEPT